ncbi:unnamed protein product [Arctia plantaginis]|uniref:Major facilitator superfamily (MFS) profile domain-containing protein n=1 Tax=Arctia plantaginis TaxID=874455 RepID=A0A8S0YPH9_ARCPL|nr:unnamed protein product [Arctia plantaginis]
MDNKAENVDKSDTSTQATPTTADQQTQTPSNSPIPTQETSTLHVDTVSPNDQLTSSSNKSKQVLMFKDLPGPSKETSRSSKYSEDLELDADVLEDVLFYVGEMGLYQKLMFLSMMLFTTFASWVYLVQIFITVTPSKYWCKVSKLASLSMELRRNLSAPGAATGDWDKCHTFDIDWDQVLQTLTPPPPQTPKIPCPDGWEFEFTDIPYETVVSERGWVCNRATYAPTAQSIFFIGSLTGGVVFGWIADNLGRIPALIGSNLIGAIGGITTIYTSGLWDFIFCRFLVGMSYDNCFMIAYILILEYVGPGHRTWVANMPVAIFGGAASVCLPWLAYFVADWRVVLWITSLPMLTVIASPWFLPESVRWLVSRGRIDDAVKVVRRFERVNRSHVPDHVMDTFIATSKKLSTRKMESLYSLFQSMLLRTTMIYMVVVYSSNAVIYDTLVRIIEVLGLDFFVTFTLNEAIEIPSVLVLTLLLDRLGRRILTGGSLLVGSVVLFIATAVPKGPYRVALGVLARFLINLAFTVLCQWGTEILPTPFRGSGSSMLHMSGFAFSLISPFIVLSALDWPPLPLLIVSVWSIITASLSVLLPETKGQEMPQTITDAEKIIMNESLCKQPEVQQFKRALSKVVSTTVNDTVSRDPEGRISRLRLSVSGIGR